MDLAFAPLNPTPRTLMGPGPSDVHPRVTRALAAPTVGHLDPQFLQMMDEVKALLQHVFQTQNALTFAVSATGSAGMECCIANVVECGDRMVVGVNGVFGGRMAEIGRRLGAEVVEVHAPWGEPIPIERIRDAVDGKPTKLIGIVHAETSTGVRQPMEGLSEIARSVDALLLADCVTSLGGCNVAIDEWGIDLAYSGTQKCLSCPPGLAPVTFGERAVEVVKNRKSKCVSWYLDVSLLLNYWSGERVYHHTAPINMLYALREALMILTEEGLENAFARHRRNHEYLAEGLAELGLELHVAPEVRLPQLNTVRIPDDVDDAAVRKALLHDYNLEIGGGLGDLKGKVWRIGLMGYASRRENVALLLAALRDLL